MSAKNNDNHNRFRSQTIAFRVSPEEDKQINFAVSLSGMTKQDYITHKLLDRTINVNSKHCCCTSFCSRTFAGYNQHFWHIDTFDLIPLFPAQRRLRSGVRLDLPQIRYCLRYDRTRIVSYYKQTNLVYLYIKRRRRRNVAPLCLTNF